MDFTPEGAAIHPGERTAVVADVHLGYEWAAGAAGIACRRIRWRRPWSGSPRCSPAPMARLVVAGDLVESGRPCRTDRRRCPAAARLARIAGRDAAGARRQPRPRASRSGGAAGGRPHRRRPARVPPARELHVDGWTIAHGDRPIVGERTVSGHFHPVLRVEGIAAPCFLAGPDRIVLPAFSANAAGCDVLTAPSPPSGSTRRSAASPAPGPNCSTSAPCPPSAGAVGLSGLTPPVRSGPIRVRPESLTSPARPDGPVHRPPGLPEAIVR